MTERLTLFRGAALHVSEARDVRPHATQAWKLVVGVDAPLRVAWDGRVDETRAVLVAPFAEQAMAAAGVSVAWFVEPGALGTPYPRGHAPVTFPGGRRAETLARIARSLALESPGDGVTDATREAFAALGLPRAERVDRRVERALREGAAEPSASVEELARRSGTSAVRLRHLVHASTGLSLRSHRVWHRTLACVEAILAGASIAAAAHAAGFTDHAHFTRAFARFFGRTPSSLPREASLRATFAERAPQAAAAAALVASSGGRR